MTSIKLMLTGAQAWASVNGPLTSGMVGIPVTIEYDEAWNGLTKNLMCRCSPWGSDNGENRAILNVGENATVAHEVMQSDMYLYLGVEGFSDDGKLVIPTTWARCGKIEYGANTCEDPSADPELSVWNQLQTEIAQIQESALTQEQVADIQTYALEATQAAQEARQAADEAKQAANVGGSGLYYTPVVTQPTSDTLKFEFKPSVTGAPVPKPVTVELPVSEDSDEKLAPIAKTEDMTQPVGMDEDGRLWTAPTGGGSSGGGDTTVHGVVWDLSNVTSSSNVVSISNGASLVAVLTAASGYRLGDVTVTIGGEALTGVWNAETSTIVIMAVTGDVMISCAGVEQTEPVDTSPVIAQFDKAFTQSEIVSKTGSCITEVYAFTPMLQQFIDAGYYNEDTGAVSYGTVCPAITFCIPNAKHAENGGSTAAPGKMALLIDGVQKNYNSNSTPGTATTGVLGANGSTLAPQYNGVAFSLYIADIDDSYAYWDDSGGMRLLPDGIRHGDIIFAGKNTPYYGMTNIDGSATTASKLSFDDDIAQDYPVTAASILGEELATDAPTAYGISNELATLLDTVRREWMQAYAGNYMMIPIIVSTDQHGRRNAGIFNFLGKTLSLYDVSKILNLGDTTSGWSDADIEHPLIADATLEAWCESVKAIPYSKRLDTFGNHDAWYGNHEDEGNIIGTRYPSSQAHLNQYFRNIYARRTNNNGWFVVRDDAFNIKYVVISGYEYKDGYSTTRIGTAQMRFIIDEFNADDGYDIIVVSHEPLWQVPASNIYPTGDESSGSSTLYSLAAIDTTALFNARKNKGSGKVTDSDGVEHNFDFSNCNTEILCGLHGHMHYDAYNYVGGAEDGLMNMAFDWFEGSTIHFVLVDRVNRQLNIWKVEGTALTYTNYLVPLDKPVE